MNCGNLDFRITYTFLALYWAVALSVDRIKWIDGVLVIMQLLLVSNGYGMAVFPDMILSKILPRSHKILNIVPTEIALVVC